MDQSDFSSPLWEWIEAPDRRPPAPATGPEWDSAETAVSTAILAARIREGWTRLVSDQASMALALFRQAEIDHPQTAAIHYWQALAHRRLGAREACQAALRRAALLAPEFWPASFLLAGLHEEQGERELALTAYQRALSACELPPNNGSTAGGLEVTGLRDVAEYRPQVATACRRKIRQLRADLPHPSDDDGWPPPR